MRSTVVLSCWTACMLAIVVPHGRGGPVTEASSAPPTPAVSVALTVSVKDATALDALDSITKAYKRARGANGPLNLLGVQSVEATRVPRVTFSLTDTPVHHVLRVLADATSSDLRMDGNTVIFRIGARMTESETLFFLPLPELFRARAGLPRTAEPSQYISWFRKRGIDIPAVEKTLLAPSEHGPVTLMLRGAREHEVELATALVALVVRGNAVLPADESLEPPEKP